MLSHVYSPMVIQSKTLTMLRAYMLVLWRMEWLGIIVNLMGRNSKCWQLQEKKKKMKHPWDLPKGKKKKKVLEKWGSALSTWWCMLPHNDGELLRKTKPCWCFLCSDKVHLAISWPPEIFNLNNIGLVHRSVMLCSKWFKL